MEEYSILEKVVNVLDGEDTRGALLSFQYNGEEYGVYFLSLPGWIVTLSLMIVEAIVAALIAVVLYYTTVKPRKEQKPGPPLQGLGTISTFVVIVFWFVVPSYFLEQVGIKNKIIRFALGVSTPTASSFRAIEALFGFFPSYATSSLGRFIVVYSSPLVLVFDDSKSNKWVRASGRQTIRHLLRFVGFVLLAGLYTSLFSLPFTPYLASSRPDDYYSWKRIVDPTNWGESITRALVFQLSLSTMGEGLAFFTSFATRIQTDPIMGNPLLESTSPSEFWGVRWNRLFHGLLKRGVYKPCRSLGASKFGAVLATFVASGLFHEFALPIVFTDIQISHGPTTLFFVWQAGLVALEYSIGHWSIFRMLAKSLPSVARTGLLILVGVPIAHLFMDLYVHSNYFQHFMLLTPCVLPLDR